LACPTRKTIADVLVEEGAYSQTGLFEAVEVDRSTVSKHLAKLAEADLVEVEDAETIQYSPSDLLRDWAEKHRSSPS
jgi:predicted transcriptional regulator